MKLAPSILTADFANLGTQVQAAEQAGVHYFHLDVMDAHFVPNLSIGPAICAAVQRSTQLPCEAHLMMTHPEPYLADYQAAGMQRIIVHIEACPHIYATLQNIRKMGMGTGVALNPSTPLSAVEEVLPLVDLVLLMGVVPGFGGQSYISNTSQRIRRMRAMLDAIGSTAEIEIDGGINISTLREVYEAGASMVVVGSAVYNKTHSVAASVALLNQALHGDVVNHADTPALMHACAQRIVNIAAQATAERGVCHIALSGGSTPKTLYELLATPAYATQLDWAHVHVWWGDERPVPADHADSNYRMANEALIRHIPIPPQNVHRVQTELGAAAAAAHYEAELMTMWRSAVVGQFDLILLGMGDDGHTASLFPGTLGTLPTDRWVTHNFVPKFGVERITFTPKLINAAREVMFVLAGANKCGMLARVLNGPYQPDTLPSQIVHPNPGHLVWMTAL